MEPTALLGITGPAVREYGDQAKAPHPRRDGHRRYLHETRAAMGRIARSDRLARMCAQRCSRNACNACRSSTARGRAPHGWDGGAAANLCPAEPAPDTSAGRAVKWCRVFPGREDQVRCVRAFLAELLAGHPGSDDVVLCAAELATNAIRHTASRGGLFAVEVGWAGRTVHLAVADSGAPAGPVLRKYDPEALEEAGRGLDVVARLSDRHGAEGDHRGRLVWAEFRSAVTAAPGASEPLTRQAAIEADAAMLTRQYAAWHTWFGPWTRQWWAIPKHGPGSTALITATSARALASHLDAIQADSRHARSGLRSPRR